MRSRVPVRWARAHSDGLDRHRMKPIEPIYPPNFDRQHRPLHLKLCLSMALMLLPFDCLSSLMLLFAQLGLDAV
jgi:hypothetical protein